MNIFPVELSGFKRIND